MINEEREKNLFSSDLYKNFSLSSTKSLKNLKNIIDEYKNKNYKCIGYGASAKGQVTLCAGEIKLDYIIDENPFKIGLFSPMLDIPIVDLKEYENDNSKKFLIVLLAWNFSKEIIEKIQKINKKATIVIVKKYFPDLELVEFN